MSLGDVGSLLAYWGEYPPVHIILRARYMKPRRNPAPEPLGPKQMAELGSMLGAPQPMKPYMKELLDWAEEQNKTTNNG